MTKAEYTTKDRGAKGVFTCNGLSARGTGRIGVMPCREAYRCRGKFAPRLPSSEAECEQLPQDPLRLVGLGQGIPEHAIPSPPGSEVDRSRHSNGAAWHRPVRHQGVRTVLLPASSTLPWPQPPLRTPSSGSLTPPGANPLVLGAAHEATPPACLSVCPA